MLLVVLRAAVVTILISRLKSCVRNGSHDMLVRPLKFAIYAGFGFSGYPGSRLFKYLFCLLVM